MKAQLVFLLNGVEQESLDLGTEPLIIGRDKGDITIDDIEISSTHCQILLLGDTYTLVDLNSSNGTFLNGQRIVKSQLTDGDKIRIGNTEIIFKLVNKSESQEHLPIFLYTDLPAPQENPAKMLDDVLNKLREHYIHTLFLLLDVTYPDSSQEIISVQEKELILGRLTVFGKFAKDDELSRRHAKIYIDNQGKLWIEDLNSTNGVFVNNIRINQKTQITPQDIIRIGRSRLKVGIQHAAEYNLL